MTEPTIDSSSTALFNLAFSLGNPRLEFPKYKKTLIQHSSNGFKSHHSLGLAGYFLPESSWLRLNLNVPTPRPENDRPDDLPANPTNGQTSIYAQDMKEYTAVSNGISTLRALIILNIPPYIVKSLEDPELGIALVTSLQIVEATYLALGTVHAADIEVAQAKINLPMETPYEVHLTNFTKMTDFLANNDAAVSTVNKIKLLTDAMITFPPLHDWAKRFNEFFPNSIDRTFANFNPHYYRYQKPNCS